MAVLVQLAHEAAEVNRVYEELQQYHMLGRAMTAHDQEAVRVITQRLIAAHNRFMSRKRFLSDTGQSITSEPVLRPNKGFMQLLKYEVDLNWGLRPRNASTSRSGTNAGGSRSGTNASTNRPSTNAGASRPAANVNPEPREGESNTREDTLPGRAEGFREAPGSKPNFVNSLIKYNRAFLESYRILLDGSELLLDSIVQEQQDIVPTRQPRCPHIAVVVPPPPAAPAATPAPVATTPESRVLRSSTSARKRQAEPASQPSSSRRRVL
ncbi:hypothetical protein H106_02538 [Trichophyton rubrum CBS 735.88]|nr:hypothetical protein H106_02538 [Trichophyton rubrum CBS 735.88]